ncbi:MAG: S1/P1 nuclease [Bacteriovoracaceae bacterium]
MIRVFAAFLLLTTNAFAWGPIGHKIVGQIAEDNLTPKALTAVKNLLQTQTMAAVATWADTIRSTKEWENTKTWHFVTIEDGLTYEEAPKEAAGDVIESIDSAMATLKNSSAAKSDQLNAIKFLIHFVGDAHQPLHVGRGEDRGGNEIQINFQGKRCNLHALWDSILIDSQKTGVREYATKLQNNAHRQVLDLTFNYDQIVKENMDLRKQVYDFKDSNLNVDYLNKNIDAVNSRLFLGGKRLATILNEIYK